MANINRDYIVVVDVKKSSISLANGTMIFNTLDKNTSNIFINLVINTSNNSLINRYANIENAEDYTVSMNIVKPNNECLTLEAVLHDRNSALFEIELPTRATDVVGNYSCELLTKCNINGRQEVTTSNVVDYVVQKSVFTDVSSEVLESEKYPIVMEMFDKLSDIDRYEEDRRQEEIVRQVNERNREQYFDAMTGGMQDEFNDLMDVMTEQVERIEERYANTDFGIFHARFEAVEEVNNIQNERLRNIEGVNKNQDVNIACLFADSDTQRATIEVEGNNTPLLNSKDGFALVHDIEGRTMVNLNKDVDKSLTLNGIINLEGQDIITTQGVDGGLVDVYLEGNTMVNVCDQEDEVSLPVNLEMRYLYTSTEYTIQFTSDTATTADITLGGTTLSNQNVVAGLNKITITTSSTLVDNKLKIDGIGCNISNIVVTEATDMDFGYFREMKSIGELEELRVMSSNSDNSQSSSKQLTHEPLRGVGDVKDKYVLIDGEWYIERLFNQVALDGGSDENWRPPDTAYDNVVAFTISLSNEPKSKGVCISSNFLYKFANEDSEHFYTGGELVIFINKSKLSTPDVNGFKTWLSQNPTTVVYQLATPTYEKIDYNPLPVYLDMTYITTNSTIPANLKVKNHGFNALLKPSTTYTIASNQGTQTFVTGAEIDDSLRLYGEGTMNDVRVFEGAVTDIPSHFSGIESAFEQAYDEEVGKYKVEIRTTGKNLFDLNKLNLSVQEEGLTIDGSKIKLTRKNTSSGFFAYCEIKLKPNTIYTFSCNNPYGQGVFYCYTDRLLGNRLFTAQSNKIFTTINQTDYIVSLYMSSAENEVEWTDIQIEEGNTATAYEPYKSSTISFYLDEPLRGIGDVRDRVFIQDGEVKVERKIGKTVLDGSTDEEWIGMADNSHGISNFRTLIPGIKAFSNDTVISDKYTVDTSLQTAAIREGILISEGTSFYLRKRTAIVGGLEQLRLYLQSNPATIIYELATPTVEVIDGVGGRLAVEIYENGHLSFNTNIPVSSELEYTVSVPVLENVAEVASITDEQDMLIVDMATQLAIMNLTL